MSVEDIKRNFFKTISENYLLTVQISLLVILTVMGIYTVSELSERQRLISYYRSQLDDVERKILSNFHLIGTVSSNQKGNQELDKVSSDQDQFVMYRVPRTLVDEIEDLDTRYGCLEELIIQGNQNEIQGNQNEACRQEGKSTNVLMASLILLATLTGSMVQSLREKDGRDELADFLTHISSGLGAGIVCALFLTSTGSSSTQSMGVFLSLGPSMKALVAFLVGMFSKELYELLADGVPAIFNLVRRKIPGNRPKKT